MCWCPTHCVHYYIHMNLLFFYLAMLYIHSIILHYLFMSVLLNLFYQTFLVVWFVDILMHVYIWLIFFLPQIYSFLFRIPGIFVFESATGYHPIRVESAEKYGIGDKS
jgi:hypothetical protein